MSFISVHDLPGEHGQVSIRQSQEMGDTAVWGYHSNLGSHTPGDDFCLRSISCSGRPDKQQVVVG